MDYYSKTLTEAINNASRFHRGIKAGYTPVAPVLSTFVAEEARTPGFHSHRHPRERDHPRGRDPGEWCPFNVQ